MDRFGITLIMWFHGLMSVQAQGAGFDSVQRIKAAQACMAAVADADWLICRAAEGALAGGGVVKVAHYDAAANRVIIIHEVPRLAPRMLRFASPLGGR